MRSIFVGLVCLLIAGCDAQEVERVEASRVKTNNQVPNGGETSDAELTCISCGVFTEEVIAGEEYHCWLESRHDEKEAIFDLSTVDDSKRFLIPKGEMLCKKEGKSRLYPSGKEIQPLNE